MKDGVLAGGPIPEPKDVEGLNENNIRAIVISGGVRAALKCLGPLPQVRFLF